MAHHGDVRLFPYFRAPEIALSGPPGLAIDERHDAVDPAPREHGLGRPTLQQAAQVLRAANGEEEAKPVRVALVSGDGIVFSRKTVPVRATA